MSSLKSEDDLQLADGFLGGCIEDMERIHIECDVCLLPDAQLGARVDA